MPYPIHNILPNDRSLSQVNGTFIETTTDPELVNLRHIPLIDNEKQFKLVSLLELGSKLGFVYHPYLTFLHENDLRDCALLGLDDTSDLESSTSLDVIAELEAGDLHHDINIQHIGECGGVDLGYGVFATTRIPEKAFVGEYTGIVSSGNKHPVSHCGDDDGGEGHPSGAYSVHYPCGDRCLEICAREQGNAIRLVNHSANPNCGFRHVLHDRTLHVVCMTLRPIEAGEQLTVDYGASYWQFRAGPITIRSSY